MNYKIQFYFVLLVTFLTCCSKKDPEPTKSSAKAITSFSFDAISDAQVSIDSLTSTISVTVGQTDLTKLIPTLKLSDKATVTPASGTAQDFSKVVTYTVTAEDGSKRAYTVKVSIAKSSENSLLTFAFKQLTPAVEGQLDANGTTVNVTVPSGTNVKALVPTITSSPKSTISPASGIVQDFSSTVVYTITAENGAQKKINVIVKVAGPTNIGSKNQTLYFGDGGGYLYAINANTGVEKWHNYTGGNLNSPIVSGGLVYYGSTIMKFFALDTLTGQKKWQYDSDSRFISSPTISNGTIYVGGNEGEKLYAIDANSGTLKWNFTAGDVIKSSPTVSNGLVYFGCNNDNVYAINATNGSVKWTFKQPYFAGVNSSPVIDNGLLFITGSGTLYVIDATTGTQKWNYNVPSTIFGITALSDPFVKDGVVYFGATDGYVYAFNISDGSLKWKYKGNGELSSPFVSNGIVYIGSTNKKLYAIDASNGNEKWNFVADDYFFSTPTVVNGVVYVTSVDKYLYALDATKGTKYWSFKAENAIYSSPCVVTKDGVYRGLGNIHP